MTDLQSSPLAQGLARAARNYDAGRYDAMHEVLDRLETEFGTLAEIEHSRGLALCAQGQMEDGMTRLHQAADFLPHDGGLQADIGALLAQQGKYAEALPYFERATDLAPDYAAGWSNLGAVHFMMNEHAKAIRPLRRAVSLDPNLLDAQINLATALTHANRFRQAVDAYYKALTLNPNDVTVHLGLSGALYRMERHDTALYHARKALELRPDTPQAHLHIGNALASLGEIDEAAEHLLIAANAPGGVGALIRLVHLRKTTRDSIEFQRLSNVLNTVQAQNPDHKMAGLHFAAGKAFADLKEFDRSFDQFAKGNAITGAEVSFDMQNHVEQVDRMMAVASPALIARMRGTAGVSDIAPIFVCGMPRSGTTLTELMLSRHSAVQAGGELSAARQALGQVRRLVDHLEERDGAEPMADEITQLGEFYMQAVRGEGLSETIVTDKMPINHMYVGLLALALPRAKFLIMRRDPMDCCLSNWTQNFGQNQPFSTDLATLGQVYMQYHRISEYWAQCLPEQVRILPYEDIVEHPKETMQSVLSFCGLDWEEAVLDHQASSRAVNTASISQVRQPLYRTSMGKWSAYGAHLQPLAREVAPLLSPDARTVAGL